MSVTTLMKNIYTFANILCQAGSDAILKWDNKTVDKAFDWAKYCQQAYKEIIGKQFEEEIDRHIKGLVIHLRPTACLHEFDLKTLENSSYKLFEILIQNPSLNNNLLEHLINLKLGTDSDLDVERLIKIYARPATKLASVYLLEKLSDQCSCPVPAHSFCLQAQANVLLQCLENQFSLSNFDRFERYLNSLLERILKNSEGLDIIMRLLTTDNCNMSYTTEQIYNLQKIQQLVLTFIQQNISLLRESLLSVEPDVLCKVACAHAPMLQMYMQSLMNVAQQMQPHYGNFDTGALYTWRSKEDLQGRQLMTYKDILQYFQRLYTCSEQSRLTLTQFLQTLSQNSFVNIYKDILRYLEKNKDTLVNR